MDEENRYDSLRSWMSTVTYILNCMYFVLKLSPFNCRSSKKNKEIGRQQKILLATFPGTFSVHFFRYCFDSAARPYLKFQNSCGCEKIPGPSPKIVFIRISPSINIGSGSEYSPIRSVIIWGVIAAKILFQILLCRTFVLYIFFSENTRTEI